MCPNVCILHVMFVCMRRDPVFVRNDSVVYIYILCLPFCISDSMCFYCSTNKFCDLNVDHVC